MVNKKKKASLPAIDLPLLRDPFFPKCVPPVQDISQRRFVVKCEATDNTVLPSELKFSCELDRRNRLQICNVALLGRQLHIRMLREGQTYFHSGIVCRVLRLRRVKMPVKMLCGLLQGIRNRSSFLGREMG